MATIRSRDQELVAPGDFDALWARLLQELRGTDYFEHDTIRELSADELRECLRRASVIPRNA
jgi:hypothetical protein